MMPPLDPMVGVHLHVALRWPDRRQVAPSEVVKPGTYAIPVVTGSAVTAYVDGDSGVVWGEKKVDGAYDGTAHIIVHLPDLDRPRLLSKTTAHDLAQAVEAAFPGRELVGEPVPTLASSWSTTADD